MPTLRLLSFTSLDPLLVRRRDPPRIGAPRLRPRKIGKDALRRDQRLASQLYSIQIACVQKGIDVRR